MTVFLPRNVLLSGKRVKGKRWVVTIRGLYGKPIKVGGFDDKPTTVRLEERLIELRGLREMGLPLTPELKAWLEVCPSRIRERLCDIGFISTQQAASAKTLLELRGEYEKHLKSKGSSKKHVAQAMREIRTILDGIGATRWTEIDAGRVENWLLARREAGVNANTSNHYLVSIQGFCRWAVREGAADADPLVRIAKLNTAKDARYARRALEIADLWKFLKAAEKGPVIDGMSGPDRALLYFVAARTGFRLGELGKLTVGSFDLVAETVRIRASWSKNATEATLPLHPEIVSVLKERFKDRLPSALAFPIPSFWKEHGAASAVKADLEAAGLPYCDEHGAYFGFHSLRVQFGTDGARQKIPLVVMQKLMRHSDPRLTAGLYTKLNVEDLRGAMDSLPGQESKPRDEAKEA